MRNFSRIFVLLAIAVFLIAGNSMAVPVTVSDEYWGADDHGYEDVIGETNKFDIQKAEIDLTGTILKIDIYTSFAGRGDDKLFSNYTVDEKGIGYGDLFLSSNWNPYGVGPHYVEDNHYSPTTTAWTYAFSLDDRWRASGQGIGGLYAMDSNTEILLSNDFITGGTYRNGQEVAIDVVNNSDPIVEGKWTIYDTMIRFLIDLDGTDLLSGNEIAFHWAMTCGNDTIEGKIPAPVPEPATTLLFGCALVGMAAVRRKKFQKLS